MDLPDVLAHLDLDTEGRLAMSLPWWGWIAFVVMTAAGIGVLVAPFIGAALARRDVPMPEDRPSEAWRTVRVALKRALSWTLDFLEPRR